MFLVVACFNQLSKQQIQQSFPSSKYFKKEEDISRGKKAKFKGLHISNISKHHYTVNPFHLAEYSS